MAERQDDVGTTAGKPEGRTLSIVGFVLAGISVFVAPIILGPIAAILGWIAMSKGDPLGRWALAAGIAGTIIGFALGAALIMSMRS